MEKTVYKLDSKGKVRFLKISTEDADVIQEHGLLDGKTVVNRSTSIGKNIGKNNETTPEEQAVLEANSKVTKKLKTGYFLTLKDAKETKVILPTLAKDYKKEKDKIIFPCYVQPKLDGMRCLGKSVEMKSRDNTPIITMNHIQEELKDLNFTIDGELYAHGKSFQENMKLIKKNREGTENVKYHVYDLISDEPFSVRFEKLKEFASDKENIELVPTYVINNEDDLRKYHQKFLSEGYEGTIVRWGEVGYPINKRSSNLLKYKDFIDIACEVVGVTPSIKRPEHGIISCKLENGKIFGCGMKFSHNERKQILENSDDYIGETAEIRFFEYSDDGIPRFPVCVGFRLDK